MDKDDKLIEFDSKYPHTLPEDWKDKLAPTVYEVLATSNTLKKMYAEQVKDIEKGVISIELGEENLRILRPIIKPSRPYFFNQDKLIELSIE